MKVFNLFINKTTYMFFYEIKLILRGFKEMIIELKKCDIHYKRATSYILIILNAHLFKHMFIF